MDGNGIKTKKKMGAEREEAKQRQSRSSAEQGAQWGCKGGRVKAEARGRAGPRWLKGVGVGGFRPNRCGGLIADR